MIITVTGRSQPRDRQVEIENWCARNGFSATDVVQPCWVDTKNRTIKMNKILPIKGQEDADFPELQVDKNGKPLTTEVLVALLVDPPSWLVSEQVNIGAGSRSQTL